MNPEDAEPKPTDDFLTNRYPANPMSMDGRRVLVTGASSGIGRAVAMQLSRLGASLILTSRRGEELQNTLSLLNPGDHHIAEFDLTNSTGISGWMTDLASEYGRFNALVHCAGVSSIQALRFVTDEDIDLQIDLNWRAAIHLIKAFRRNKSDHPRRSSILLLSSVAAIAGYPGWSVYASTKAALTGLTRSLAVELAPENIRVNCIAPGWVETAMTEQAASNMTEKQKEHLREQHLLGLGEPADVAGPAAFLISDCASWITGELLVVDGGRTA